MLDVSISPWVWYTTTAALALGAGYAAVYLIRPTWSAITAHRRGTPQRRCPRCRYDMIATAGLRCPECGKTAKGERFLARPPVPWLRLSLCMAVIAVSLGLTALPSIMRVGLIKSLPDWSLLTIASMSGMSTDDPIVRELLFRAWDPQNADRRSALLTRLGPALLATRSRWPQDTPLRFIALQPAWSVRIAGTPPTPPTGRLAPLPHSIRPRSFDFISHEPVWEDCCETGPTLTPGVQEVQFNVAESLGAASTSGPPDAVLSRTIEIGKTAEELISPASGPALDADIAKYLNPVLVTQPTTGRLCVALIRGQPCPTSIRTLALGLKLELRIDGTLVATGQCWLPAAAGPLSELLSRLNPVLLTSVDRSKSIPTIDATTNCTLTITGDAALALSDIYANTYWSGTITLPANKGADTPTDKTTTAPN